MRLRMTMCSCSFQITAPPTWLLSHQSTCTPISSLRPLAKWKENFPSSCSISRLVNRAPCLWTCLKIQEYMLCLLPIPQSPLGVLIARLTMSSKESTLEPAWAIFSVSTSSKIVRAAIYQAKPFKLSSRKSGRLPQWAMLCNGVTLRSLPIQWGRSSGKEEATIWSTWGSAYLLSSLPFTSTPGLWKSRSWRKSISERRLLLLRNKWDSKWEACKESTTSSSTFLKIWNWLESTHQSTWTTSAWGPWWTTIQGNADSSRTTASCSQNTMQKLVKPCPPPRSFHMCPVDF